MAQKKAGHEVRMADIDPYTVFGLFNKGISEVNRKSIIAGIAEAFDIEAGQPTDFDGIRAQLDAIAEAHFGKLAR